MAEKKPLVLYNGVQEELHTGDTLPGAGGDLLSALLATEVSITGAVTLDSTAFGKMHVCSETTADYTVGLPPVSGNAGKLIGFRMASGLTKLVTLDGNSSETIDGEASRVMWAKETAILMCNGTEWVKIGGKSIPLSARIARNGGVDQTITNNTVTKVLFDEIISESVSGMAALTNSKINILRNGTYFVTGCLFFITYPGNSIIQMFLSKSSTGTPIEVLGQTYATSGSNPGINTTQPLKLLAGDSMYCVTRQFSGSSASIYGLEAVNYLIVQEIPTW